MKINFLKTKKDITAWLDNYEVQNYTLMQNHKYGYVVNVEGNVHLSSKNLSSIPIKFNYIAGRFWCDDNNLISLEFCPTSVGRNFSCDNNKLTSLEFCPITVNGAFFCNDNQLTSLEFCPTTVAGSFYCAGNEKLGNIQDINDFAEILKLHQEMVKAKKEKTDITDQLETISSTKDVANKRILKI